MSKLDLDAAHLAQQEATAGDEPNVLEIGGREFKLSASLPASFVVGLGRMQNGHLSGFELAVRDILADPSEFDDLLAAGLDMRDLLPIAKHIYGVDLGEAPASA